MHAPLLAAGLDWLEGLLPLLFVLFWIISQIRALFRGAGRAEKPPRPVVIARPPPVPARPDAGNERIAREIEEFLRERTRGGPAPRPTAPRPQPPKRVKRAAAEPAGRPAGRPQSAGTALGGLQGVETDVARHVQQMFAHGAREPASSAVAVRPEAGSASAPPPAALVALVRDPAALRQLFIAREVLERPVERW